LDGVFAEGLIPGTLGEVGDEVHMRAIVVMCRFEVDEWWLCFSQVGKKKKKKKTNTSIRNRISVGFIFRIFFLKKKLYSFLKLIILI